jgi:hypothetical protein
MMMTMIFFCLFMGTASTGVEVGIAWVGQLCQSETSSQSSSTGNTQYVAGAGVSSISKYRVE